MRSSIEYIKDMWREWLDTAKMLFKASPRFFLGLVFFIVLASSMLSYGLTLVTYFLDAVIGARGTQVLTSDVVLYSRRIFVVLCLFIASLTVLIFVRGRARTWVWTTLEGGLLLGVGLIALPVAIIRVPIQIILTYVPYMYRIGRWRFLIAGSVFAMTLSHMSVLVRATVYRDLTVGAMVMFLFSDIVLLGWSLWRLMQAGSTPGVGRR